MPLRQRHDEFIWALIFSLIVNLLFIFALLAQRYDAKSPGFQPLVVSIAVSRPALPQQSHANPGPTAIPAPVKAQKILMPPLTLRPQNASLDPPPPAQDNKIEGTSSPLSAPERTRTATSLLSPTTATERATATLAKETAAELSILGDKTAGAHYTAPEYLGGEKPPYPKRAERNGWAGTVLLNILINVNGEVEKVEIAKTSGYELLDRQARASVSAWRFKPARRNGIAIAVAVQQPVIFRPTLPKIDP